MHILGIDLGSSSVKVSLFDTLTGTVKASANTPANEMEIKALNAGWAEQDPAEWYRNLIDAINSCFSGSGYKPSDIGAIGISYQMHGLVAVDNSLEPVRPSIIWCDSRAVNYGEKAFRDLGVEYCYGSLLNSPGNFTVSKLAWVRDNEPALYKRIFRVMLPGDYLAMKLTGIVSTTLPGLSEAVLWDYKRDAISQPLLDYFGIDRSLIPGLVPTFGEQGRVCEKASSETGLPAGIPVTYRAGDQPNNALSLNVFNPGEVAATAGTSGVIYGISGDAVTDIRSRVNVFAHVNHRPEMQRLGVLACVNGAGIANSWLRRLTGAVYSYDEMNRKALKISPGSEGLTIFPFGNGAERILENRLPGASVRGINLNIHSDAHMCRAVQEAVAYSFRYGFDIMTGLGMKISVIKAGKANMFLSPLFRQLLSDLTGASIQLFDTDGSAGAARGAAIGADLYANPEEAFREMELIEETKPDRKSSVLYSRLYSEWKNTLEKELNIEQNI